MGKYSKFYVCLCYNVTVWVISHRLSSNTKKGQNKRVPHPTQQGKPMLAIMQESRLASQTQDTMKVQRYLLPNSHGHMQRKSSDVDTDDDMTQNKWDMQRLICYSHY
jgi:hypothetical protein